MSDFHSAVGIATIDGIDVGNALKVSLDIVTDTKYATHKKGGTYESLSRVKSISIAISLGEYNPILLGIALMGTVSGRTINICAATSNPCRHFNFIGENTITGGDVFMNFPLVRFKPISGIDILMEDIGNYNLTGIVERSKIVDDPIPYGTITV